MKNYIQHLINEKQIDEGSPFGNNQHASWSIAINKMTKEYSQVDMNKMSNVDKKLLAKVAKHLVAAKRELDKME